MEKLTKKQWMVYSIICNEMFLNGICPSIHELCKLLDFSSPNAAHSHLKALERKGYLKLIPNVARNIVITGDFCAYCEKPNETILANPIPRLRITG